MVRRNKSCQSSKAMGRSVVPIFPFLLFCLNLFHPSAAIDSLIPNQFLTAGSILVSSGGNFELGFFTVGSSKPGRLFLGIRYGKVSDQKIIWVANRQSPVTSPNATLSLSADGSLVIYQNNIALWSTNTSGLRNPSLKLYDSGNLALTDGSTDVFWQSFDHPSDAFLPDMELGLDLKHGLEKKLISWTATDDPYPGEFSYGARRTGSSELVIWNGTSIRYRTGPWAGVSWSGIPQMNSDLHFIFKFVVRPDRIAYSYESVNKSVATFIALSNNGLLQRLVWLGGGWQQYWRLPEDKCDEYRTCGPFGICNVYYPQGVCKCLRGFEPRSPVDWTLRDFSSGCRRRTILGCSQERSGDGFVKVQGVKPPDTQNVTVAVGIDSVDACGELCLKNCSCVAYVVLGGNCLWWVGELIDIKEFAAGTGWVDVYLRLAASELDPTETGSNKKKHLLTIIIPLVFLLLIFLCIGLYLLKKKRNHDAFHAYVKESRGKEMELPLFDMITIETATMNFSSANKLGEGGFGSVYKGQLRDGQEIAVKRLSRYSFQGLDEFMNEVMLIANLQHRNLVRLLDKTNGKLLGWPQRFEIILGVARGLLYLHQDSRLLIVHRDLKVSNVLLDKDMNPKISDFGMARIVKGDKQEESTEKVVGTYGYMSPEYAMHGIFSVKSDVFSFGVIILEIITGKKNRVVDPSEPHISLVGHAWQLWSENRSLELVDDALNCEYSACQFLRCMQIGLLCVQEDTDERPTMASVVLMLGSEGVALPEPKKPGFCPKDCLNIKEFSTSDQISTVKVVLMDKLRRQASKLREQVAKQQQAVIKQFSGSGYESSDVMVIDEVELYRHQQLEKLYKSTRTARDFQKDVVRAGDVFASIGQRHIEAGTKLAEDCYKYGGENHASDGTLAKAASLYGSSLVNVEREYDEYNRHLITQIMEPLRAMATGTALEDARHLAQRYSRMRHEAELQVGEISRRQSRVKEIPILENTSKLQSSESKMQDLKANMAVLGKEAAAALAAVEAQQQRLTFQRLVAMVEAEKSFHLRVAAILDDVEAEILSENKKRISHTFSPQPCTSSDL
ncbi:hypothetical protein HPP92_017849 [Vanilla planifolia]|uniref:Receptor-like serine/threonine-protein kinase n=1 Tax=Vanilla planifolia TaxID=51239 RepID=A0A835UQY6_VANPL|nr:hypothetical protein HPP92_017849 [Vanilla planifolia]